MSGIMNWRICAASGRPATFANIVGGGGESGEQVAPLNLRTMATEEVAVAKYMAIYIGTATDEEKMARPVDPATEQEGIKAWGRWAAENAGSNIDQGSPLGRTKAVDRNGIRDIRNQMTGYVIVEADSLEAAAALFRSHPHFSVFPGERVEVVECLEMPSA